MKQLLIKLLFGNDELLNSFLGLIRIRRAAMKEHERNLRLQEKVTSGLQRVAEHKAAYATTRASVEASWRLEL